MKKESVLFDRKLSTRNERIQTLESMLQDTQAKLETQAKLHECETATLRETLAENEQKQGFFSQRKQHDFNSWMYSGNIAKPLRGGQSHFASVM